MSVNLTFGSACSPKHVVTPGEPDMAPGHVTWSRVYPRVGGATSCVAVAASPVGGLSPRGRGNLGCGVTLCGA